MIRRIIFAFTLLMLASPAWAQSGGYKEPDDDKPVQRYANMPDEAVPYRRFTKPYYDWFVQPIPLPIMARQRSGLMVTRPS